MRSSLHAGLAVAVLAAAPALVRADEEEALEVDVRCPADAGDEQRAAARAEGVASILSLVPEVAFFARGPGAAAVHSAVGGCVKELGQKERDGGEVAVRFGAARSEVRMAVLDLVRPETTFARDEVLVVVPEQGLTPAEQTIARKAATDALTTYRFRVKPLGAAGSPPTLVCTVGGKVEAFDLPGGFHGLRVAGFSGRLFDKAAGRVVAERAVQSRKNTKAVCLPGVVGEPVTGGAEERTARERLVGDAARAAVMGLVERLHERSLPPDPAAPPKAELPAIASDTPRDQLHDLRFIGFTEADAEAVVAALVRLDVGFAGWERRGVDGERVDYRCAFKGQMIVKQLKAALAEAGQQAEVEKAGDVLTVRRK